MPKLGLCWGLVLAVLGPSCATSAQERQLRPLTADELATAMQLERQAVPEASLPMASRPLSSPFSSQLQSLDKVFSPTTVKQTDPDVTLLGAPGLLQSDSPRRAIVTRFDYLTGLAVTTTVDLDAKKVLDVTVARDRPVALSSAEFNRAVDLAISNNPNIRQLATEFGRDKLGFDALVPVDGLKTSPRYGHRLVLLWVETPRPSTRVMVDLTTEQVSSAD